MISSVQGRRRSLREGDPPNQREREKDIQIERIKLKFGGSGWNWERGKQ